MKKLILGTIALSLLAACEQQDLPGGENQSNSLNIEAEISANASRTSRTATNTKGVVTFAEGDGIGFYMPASEQSAEWTFTGGDWSSVSSFVWPDILNVYNFCAYYPFAQSEPRTEIEMPDLTRQDGTWENLKTYDFLAARCATNYKQHNGIVSFTGDEAFKHVYALVSVTLKGNNDTKGATLTSLTLQSNNLVTNHTYHFGETAKGDGMSVKGEEKNEFTLDNLSASISTEGHNIVLIVNPVESANTVALTVKYTRDDKNYTVSTKIAGQTIQAGSLNNLTVRIKKSGLIVEGNTIQDWNENTLPDTDVDEELLP